VTIRSILEIYRRFGATSIL